MIATWTIVLFLQVAPNAGFSRQEIDGLLDEVQCRSIGAQLQGIHHNIGLDLRFDCERRSDGLWLRDWPVGN